MSVPRSSHWDRKTNYVVPARKEPFNSFSIAMPDSRRAEARELLTMAHEKYLRDHPGSSRYQSFLHVLKEYLK